MTITYSIRKYILKSQTGKDLASEKYNIEIFGLYNPPTVQTHKLGKLTLLLLEFCVDFVSSNFCWFFVK